MDGELAIRWASDATDVQRAIAIRDRVFCDEQGVPRELELDGLDGECLHLLVLTATGGRAIGTLRLRLDGAVANIGRLAVEQDWRHRGIASRMLAIALERARQSGCRTAQLAAQLEAQRLYEQAGFAVESDPFEQAGITHVQMGLTL